jgi:hypothetical protein
MRRSGSSKGAFASLLKSLVRLAQGLKILPERSCAAIDATGLETHHVSRYYVWRKGHKRHRRYRWPKLTVVCDLHSHFWTALFVCMGPCQDSPQLPPTVKQAVDNHAIDDYSATKGMTLSTIIPRSEPMTLVFVHRGAATI